MPKVKICNLFGSFARRTKIRPLDDIDLLVVFEREGLSFSPGGYILKQAAPYLSVKDKNSPLKSFEDQSGYLNSIKVLDRIVASLRYVSNYQKAEIKRDQEAAVLNLSSHSWKFDIVPAFEFPNLFNNDTACYVIPDGRGKWMKTDPRIDAENITGLNQKYDKKFLSFLRLLKYWNNFDLNKPKLNSYYFETLVGIVFGNHTSQIKTFPEAVRYFFKNAPPHLTNSCPDPKGYGPALDSGLEPAIKKRVKDEMSEALFLCEKAIQYEEKQRHREAILLWHIIFGPEFPTYR